MSMQSRKAAGSSRRPMSLLFGLCFGGEGQNRTVDTTIFSRMLYQLSYLATRGCVLRRDDGSDHSMRDKANHKVPTRSARRASARLPVVQLHLSSGGARSLPTTRQPRCGV